MILAVVGGIILALCVALSTHDSGGLTAADLSLAGEIVGSAGPAGGA